MRAHLKKDGFVFFKENISEDSDTMLSSNTKNGVYVEDLARSARCIAYCFREAGYECVPRYTTRVNPNAENFGDAQMSVWRPSHYSGNCFHVTARH